MFRLMVILFLLCDFSLVFAGGMIIPPLDNSGCSTTKNYYSELVEFIPTNEVEIYKELKTLENELKLSDRKIESRITKIETLFEIYRWLLFGLGGLLLGLGGLLLVDKFLERRNRDV